MNRRGFLTFAAAAPLAAAIPVPAPGALNARFAAQIAAQIAAINSIRRVLIDNAVIAQAGGSYLAFMHPDCWRDIKTYEARGRWRDAWHKYRDARRHGLQEEVLSAQDVMARYAYPAAQPLRGELGSFESVRIIKSPLR